VVSAREKRRRRAQQKDKARPVSTSCEENDEMRGKRKANFKSPISPTKHGSQAPPKKRPLCQRHETQGPGLYPVHLFLLEIEISIEYLMHISPKQLN
jgi:hypothetical protein